MKKGIIVVDMPECCDLCRFSSQAYDLEPFEEGEGYCSLKMESVDRIPEGEKPGWCPIKSMPEKKPLTGDVSNFEKVGDELLRSGWNACINAIEHRHIKI